MLQQWYCSQNFQLTAFPCSWYPLSILYKSGRDGSKVKLHWLSFIRLWGIDSIFHVWLLLFFSREKVSFLASWRLTKRNIILHLERISCRLRRGRKRNLFSASTMLDGVLQLNKLSRGLFLSWSVNAVILGAGAGSARAQQKHQGIQLCLYLRRPTTLASASSPSLSPSSPNIPPHFLALSVSRFPTSFYFFSLTFPLPCLSYGKSLLFCVGVFCLSPRPTRGLHRVPL